MKPLPPELPPAHSAKWHSRRWGDSLGYLRVRSLANPNWHRDMPWLITWLRRQTPPLGDQYRDAFEKAVAAAVRYPRTEAGAEDRDASWDELLACIDDILVRRQREHMDAVRAAGFSGKDVPPPSPED